MRDFQTSIFGRFSKENFFIYSFLKAIYKVINVWAFEFCPPMLKLGTINFQILLHLLHFALAVAAVCIPGGFFCSFERSFVYNKPDRFCCCSLTTHPLSTKVSPVGWCRRIVNFFLSEYLHRGVVLSFKKKFSFENLPKMEVWKSLIPIKYRNCNFFSRSYKEKFLW